MIEKHGLQLNHEDKSKLIKASWLVEDAFRGFSRPHPRPTKQAICSYKLYHRLAILRRGVVVLLLLLSFVETPYWCHKEWPHPCGDPLDPMTPLTSGMLLLPRNESFIVEMICLIFCLFNECLLYHSLGQNFFARLDRVCALIFFSLDLLNASIRIIFHWHICAQIAPFLRLVIFVLTYRSIRSTYCKMYRVMGEVHNIITLVALYVGFFAWLATILFQDTEEGGVMKSFVESAWQLLILLTTANFPDIMMPAYTRNRGYGLFFIVFVAFGLFFMMNLILAQVFNNFQRIAAMDDAQAERNRTKLLTEAFDILISIQETLHTNSSPRRRGSNDKFLTTGRPSPTRQQVGSPPKPSSPSLSPKRDEKCSWIDTELACALFEELNHYNVASTRMSQKQMLEVFYQLDSNGDGSIELSDFFAICNCLSQYVKSYHKTPSEVERWWPHFANSSSYQTLCSIVEHKRFELAIDGVLVLNALCIVLDMATNDDNLVGQSNDWDVAQICFSSIYVIEMLLKILVKGVRDYLHSFRNKFDATITIVSLAVDIYAYIPNSFNDHTIPKVLMTFRCVRMLRLFLSIERYRVILLTAWAMAPIGKNLFLVMFCNMNVFALVGHQLFGGRISPGLLATPLFANSTFAASGYAANNFNDVPSAMVTLFELLVVNNWFVIVEGHVLVTTVWVRLFFIAFWITGVIMTLNLIIASILDAFSKEYSAAQEQAKTPNPPLSPRLRRRMSQQLLLQSADDEERRIA